MLAFAALLALAAPTCHPGRMTTVRANLDGDAAKEIVVAADNQNCAHTSHYSFVTVRDRCAGKWRSLQLVSEPTSLRGFGVVDADGWTRRREVFFATGKTAKVVRLVERRGRCPSLVALYTYKPSPIPDGYDWSGFSAELGDLTSEFRGLELRVTEFYAAGEPGPGVQRVTLFRYDSGRQRYVQYQTTPPEGTLHVVCSSPWPTRSPRSTSSATAPASARSARRSA
jgi:hypothetical protein